MRACFDESSRRDTTENSSSDDHDDLHDESFPLEPFVDKGSRMRAGGQKVRGGEADNGYTNYEILKDSPSSCPTTILPLCLVEPLKLKYMG